MEANLRVVRFDTTGEWVLDEFEFKVYINKIFSYYLVDVSAQAYLAELTPSNYYTFLYHRAEFNDELSELHPADQEKITQDVDETLTLWPNEDKYVHVGPKLPGVYYGTFVVEDEEEYYDLLQRESERICANPISNY